jgi:flavin-dependent dehydrogenase
MELFDVIIIGGGPAGSTAATTLSKMNHKALLLEKEIFPREHIGESLIPASYASLKRLGILEELKKISPRKPGVNFVNGDGKNESLWCFRNVVKDEGYLSFHVKRSMFDEMLLKNSRKNGATVIEGCTVKNVSLENKSGNVEVEAQDKSGNKTTYSGRFIIDASGQSTFLGSRLGVKKSYEDLDRVAIWSHWSNSKFDLPLQQGAIKIVYLGGEKKGWFWVIPLSSDNLSIGVVVNNSYIKKEKEKFLSMGKEDWKHQIYMQEIENSPSVKELLKNATMDHKAQVNGDYSYYCEKKYGNNYAMIGDAGAFLDPIFSSGIFVGMRSAEIVSEAVHKVLTSKDTMALPQTFEKIDGAVKVLEKFIKLFYKPEVVNFATLGDPGKLLGFEKTENIYSLFHYLLAGDFFEDHAKYGGFLDAMHNDQMVEKFRNLINYSRDSNSVSDCGESFEEMYGAMTAKLEFDLQAFS